jgi:peptidoglycan/xylan/chitin deacetylase (PgdA/CDA1 family)
MSVTAVRAVLRRHPIILCYHGVSDQRLDDDPEWLCVPPARFRRQVELLQEAGAEFVTMSELAARTNGTPPPGLAALTFDDGFQDNLTVVAPILAELGVPGTVYVATGMIGQPNRWMRPGSGLRMMDEGELRELSAANVELGAHTVTHPDMSALDVQACAQEVRESKARVEEIAGREVTSFAYPFFFYGPAAQQAVREAGFTSAVSGQGNGEWGDRYALPRALVTGKDDMPSFLLRISGMYEPLFNGLPGKAVRVTTRPARKLAARIKDARR